MGITKLILKRPITALLCILSIVFFGFISYISFKFELVPEISMPMYIVYTVYPGASPNDIDDMVTTKIEEEVYNLSGVKDVQCVSRENLSLVVIQYNYGQNMSIAYNDLKKKVDNVKAKFNDSVEDPMIVEMDIQNIPTMKLAIRKNDTEDIYNYVNNIFDKEIQKITEVASVETSGGSENYIKIELLPEKIARYNLSMDTIASIIKVADFSYPSGTVYVGNRDLSLSAQVEYDTVESLKSIPIITGNKRTLYLEDIANVYDTKKDPTNVGRYDGEDCIVVSIYKAQSASTINLSDKVKNTIKKLKADDNNLIVDIIQDQADNINASIHNVLETMVIAIILSMLVIFVFFGDLKASLIVGTSIPFSILTSLVAMNLVGFTLNLITLSSLVLGVGMMVDNSIVVLEACFRAKDKFIGNDINDYIQTVVDGTKTVGASVFGSTLTTCVVFAPLGFLSGMAGQFFKPLGFTIVFCMLASFVSAITVVPLCYCFYTPKEKTNTLGAKLTNALQIWYRDVMKKILSHKIITIVVSVVILIISFLLLKTFKTELVASSDEGMISVSITTKPSLNYEAKDKIYRNFEDYITSQPDVTHYVISNSASSMSMSGGGGQSIIAYLKDDRSKKTKDLVKDWKKDLSKFTDCTIDVSSYSTSFTSAFIMPTADKFDINIESTDYDKLKVVNDKIKVALQNRDDTTNITTRMDNAAPIIAAKIDPILAASEGFTPAEVGAIINHTVSGIELYDMKTDDIMKKVILEFPKNEYKTIDKIENLKLENRNGVSVTLKDIADVRFEDSPANIIKYNKKYRSNIVAYYNSNVKENAKEDIMKNIIEPNMTRDVTIAESTVDEMLNEEFTELAIAISVAIFLVFVVMASQFESAKYSLMVMGTVLFSLVGSFICLWLANLKLSMPTLLGLLILIGTAVNNGILYVDTANQFIEENNMELYKASIDSGALRLRPIMMTTITTIVSMIPMSLAYGKNGEILQSLAVVNIGGLITSTIMALFILPVLYVVLNSRKKGLIEQLGINARKLDKDKII